MWIGNAANARPSLSLAKSLGCERPRTPAMGSLYDTEVWDRLRKAILAREPLCRLCAKEGKNEKATQVDHILPISRGGRRFAEDNLQPLCAPCHSAKTNAERDYRRVKAPRQTDDRGYPNPDYLEWKRQRAAARAPRTDL